MDQNKIALFLKQTPVPDGEGEARVSLSWEVGAWQTGEWAEGQEEARRASVRHLMIFIAQERLQKILTAQVRLC